MYSTAVLRMNQFYSIILLMNLQLMNLSQVLSVLLLIMFRHLSSRPFTSRRKRSSFISTRHSHTLPDLRLASITANIILFLFINCRIIKKNGRMLAVLKMGKMFPHSTSMDVVGANSEESPRLLPINLHPTLFTEICKRLCF